MFVAAVSLFAMLASVIAGLSRWHADARHWQRHRRLHHVPGGVPAALRDRRTGVAAAGVAWASRGTDAVDRNARTMVANAADLTPTKGA